MWLAAIAPQMNLEIPVADPGFPKQGRMGANPKRGALTDYLSQYFAEAKY